MPDTWSVPGYELRRVDEPERERLVSRSYDDGTYYEPADWEDPFAGYYEAVGIDPAAPDPRLIAADDAEAGSDVMPPAAPPIAQAVAAMDRSKLAGRLGIAAAVGLGLYVVLKVL